ncbi:Cytochrome P450 2J5 [Araneus ventricosus]|uniref:Cytochrome P450 2J5 n=1 Tax=Araneus ventricosus TaxID=182803 RepID=A0A4Y2S4W4_ARAVE|nr:Cytochrome P450 2J5 [Araneus ventricosus]
MAAIVDTSFGWFAALQNQFGMSVVCVAVLLVVFWKRREKRKHLPPGPFKIPIVGHLPFLGEEPFRVLHKLTEKYGNVYGIYLGRNYFVILGDYKVAKEAFSKSTTTDRPVVAFDYVPDGIGFNSVNGQEWVEQRQYCVKAMKHLGIGRDSWETHVQTEVEDFVKKVSKYDGHPFDFSKLLTASIANNISSYIFGNKFPMTKENIDFLNQCVHAVSQFSVQVGLTISFPYLAHALISLGLTKYATYKKDLVEFNKFVREQVELHKRNTVEENPDNFIDGYLMKIRENQEQNLGNTFNYTNLYGNIQAMFGGASDTTKSSLSWLLLAMAADIEIQKRVHEEIDTVLGREGKIQWSDRLSLPYTYAVILEGQRWRTIVPINTSRIAMEDIKIGAYDVPKGTTILANNWGLHNDTKYWKEPEKYQPERFLLEDGKKVNLKAESYSPFSYVDLPLSDLRNVWFRHDSAPPHKVSSVQQYIRYTFQQQVIGYGGCVEWPPRSPSGEPKPNRLFYVGIHTSNSESMQPLHQHCRNFETILRMLVQACHLPCCTMCSGKCSPVSRCVLLLKDMILSMTDR